MARYTSRLKLRVDLVEYMLKVAEFSFELIYHIQWQENETELQTDA